MVFQGPVRKCGAFSFLPDAGSGTSGLPGRAFAVTYVVVDDRERRESVLVISRPRGRASHILILKGEEDGVNSDAGERRVMDSFDNVLKG